MSEQAVQSEPVADKSDKHELAPRAPGHVRAGEAKPAKRTFMDRIESFISRLSTRNNFWHRVCSMIFLPYAFRSGITMRRLDGDTFQAVLPFRKINKNWYNAMAGAALLGNTEIAGGMYVFGFCGGDYTVVCKNLEYRFLRPCLGPAIYKIRPKTDIAALVKEGGEFDATVQLDIYQAITDPRDPKNRKKKLEQPEAEKVVEKEKRVGRATAIFHATP
ncbi:MAG: hypothetical protein ACIAQ0_10125, partial [Phycisphaerales bacterium JB058]